MSATTVRRPGRASGWGARAAAWAEQEEQQVPTYAETLRRVELERGAAVLDVGCGSGVFLRLAADRGARASGLDASEELVALARRRVPEADVRVGEMQQLPYDDASFDLVAGFNAFFFAADMVAALREAGRVARPGAPVIVQVWGRPERCDLTAMKDAVFPLGPPAHAAPAPAPPLWHPGVLEGLARAAQLTPRLAFDIRYAFAYPDAETLVRRMLAPAPVVAAVEAVGEARVLDEVLRSLAPYRTAEGGFRLDNEWRVLVASA